MTEFDPKLAAEKANKFIGILAEKMSIKFTEFSKEKSIATMPVAGNTQPYGLLHGGAHLVLAETMGSIMANFTAGDSKVAVGIEIGASHSGSVTSGLVTGVCTPIHLGRTLMTHEIAISDESGKRLSTVRITNLLKDAN